MNVKREDDETRILKYKLTKTDDQKSVDIKYIEQIGTVFKGGGVNSEGIEVIESEDENEEFKGFLITNDVFCKPTFNSNLYFINNKMESKILLSLNDDGIAELNDICKFNGFGKNGYLILPQSLNLGYLDGDKKRQWDKFNKWSVTNDGDASLYFVNKEDILKGIKGGDKNDEDEKDDKGSIEMEKITVVLENVESEENLFKKFPDGKEEGYQAEGFEAICLNENNDALFSLEYSKKEDTFNFLLTGKFVKNEEKEDRLEIRIDPCKYVKIENNGAGSNYSQESLLFVKF